MKRKASKKRDWFLVWKWNLIIELPSEIKFFAFDPAFLNWVNFISKESNSNCFRISQSFKAIFFFFEVRKLRFFQKIRPYFFSVYLLGYFSVTVCWLFSFTFHRYYKYWARTHLLCRRYLQHLAMWVFPTAIKSSSDSYIGCDDFFSFVSRKSFKML